MILRLSQLTALYEAFMNLIVACAEMSSASIIKLTYVFSSTTQYHTIASDTKKNCVSEKNIMRF